MLKKYVRISAALVGLIFFFTINSESQLKTVVSVTGSVFNQQTKDPIGIKYKLLDDNGKTFRRGKTNPAQNGYYFITGLKPGMNYTIVFEEDNNYFKAEHPIEIPNTDKYQEFSRDFMLIPKYKGVEIAQRVPVFELNKTKLRGGADFFLDDFMKTLEENPGIKFKIVAFPDDNEHETVNEALTKARCNALKDYFTSKGIEGERIQTEANKTIDPKNPLPTEKRAKGKRYIGSVYYVVEKF